MATSGDERRMVFDIRGRRKNVVKVVYAILALLMGLSLFLLAGPGIGGIFSEGVSNNAASQLEDQAEKIELKLKKDPEDPAAAAGSDPGSDQRRQRARRHQPRNRRNRATRRSRAEQLEEASDAWSKYLKTSDEPNPGGAQLGGPGALRTGADLPHRAGSRGQPRRRGAGAADRRRGAAEPGQPQHAGDLPLLLLRFRRRRAGAQGSAPYANTKFERENLGNELDQTRNAPANSRNQLVEFEREAKKARDNGEPGAANPLSATNPLAQP